MYFLKKKLSFTLIHGYYNIEESARNAIRIPCVVVVETTVRVAVPEVRSVTEIR